MNYDLIFQIWRIVTLLLFLELSFIASELYKIRKVMENKK